MYGQALKHEIPHSLNTNTADWIWEESISVPDLDLEIFAHYNLGSLQEIVRFSYGPGKAIPALTGMYSYHGDEYLPRSLAHQQTNVFWLDLMRELLRDSVLTLSSYKRIFLHFS